MVLFWPTTCLPPKQEEEEDSSTQCRDSGFIIGWDDYVSNGRNDGAATTVTTPTSEIICAGIIDDKLVSFEQIQTALENLRRDFSYDDGNDCSTIINESKECEHYNYSIIQSLKVVAIWKNESIADGCTHDGASSTSLVESTSKLLGPKQHPHQHQMPLHLLPVIATKSKSRIPTIIKHPVNNQAAAATSQHLFLFEPCSSRSLDYYNHSFDTSYHSLFATYDETNNDNDDGGKAGERGERRRKSEQNKLESKSFSTLLMQITETETIMHLVNHYLKDLPKKDDHDDSDDIISRTEIKKAAQRRTQTVLPAPATTATTSSNHKTNEKTFFHHMVSNLASSSSSSSSLTTIHLRKNLSKHNQKRRDQHIIIDLLIANSPILFLCFSHTAAFHDNTTYHTTTATSNSSNKLYISRKERSIRQLYQDGLKWDAIVDGVLGLICGVTIMSQHKYVLILLGMVWNGIHGRLLRDNIGWLETFPAGFKLNVPLTKVMGAATLWLTETHENYLRSIFFSMASMKSDNNDDHYDTHDEPSKLLIMVLGIISIIFGFKLCCTIVFDLARVITIHIHFMARIFQYIYQMQLSLLSSLWHLFQGKKKNVLRKRSDTLEFDFMQLLLGMILFTICLFLFTTIFVYYTFFACIHLAVTFCVMWVWGWYVLVDKLPIGNIVTAVTSPGRFRTEVYFVNISQEELKHMNMDAIAEGNSNYLEGTMNIYQMVASNLNPVSIVSQALTQPIMLFLKQLPSFLGEILSGESCSVIRTCLKISS